MIRAVLAWIREQYGFGFLFALEAIWQIFAVKAEASEATERQAAR